MTYNKSKYTIKLREATEAVFRGKFIGLYAYIRKDEILIINKRSFYLTNFKKIAN